MSLDLSQHNWLRLANICVWQHVRVRPYISLRRLPSVVAWVNADMCKPVWHKLACILNLLSGRCYNVILLGARTHHAYHNSVPNEQHLRDEGE